MIFNIFLTLPLPPTKRVVEDKLTFSLKVFLESILYSSSTDVKNHICYPHRSSICYMCQTWRGAQLTKTNTFCTGMYDWKWHVEAQTPKIGHKKKKALSIYNIIIKCLCAAMLTINHLIVILLTLASMLFQV